MLQIAAAAIRLGGWREAACTDFPCRLWDRGVHFPRNQPGMEHEEGARCDALGLGKVEAFRTE